MIDQRKLRLYKVLLENNRVKLEDIPELYQAAIKKV